VEAKDNITNEIFEKIKLVANLIRENSREGKFTKYMELSSEPINIEEKSINEIMESLKSSDDYKDIVELKGNKGKYLYSNSKMTSNYAKIRLMIEEKDLLKLFVDTVRYNSKVYPRTTALCSFYDEPFNFTEEIKSDILKQIKENSEYEDIKETTVSNGKVCLYSTKHLSKDHAESLAEWIEVGQYESQ
jgi:hypothetical protein